MKMLAAGIGFFYIKKNEMFCFNIRMNKLGSNELKDKLSMLSKAAEMYAALRLHRIEKNLVDFKAKNFF